MDQSRLVTEIQPGFYSMKMVKDGPAVPVLVEQRGDRLYLIVNGVELEDSYRLDGVEDRIAATMLLGEANKDPLVRVHWADRIDQHRYQMMLDAIAYFRVHKKDHPMLRPREPVDLKKVSPLW